MPIPDLSPPADPQALASLGWASPAAVNAPANAPPPPPTPAIPPPTPHGLGVPGAQPWVTSPQAWATPEAPPPPPARGVPYVPAQAPGVPAAAAPPFVPPGLAGADALALARQGMGGPARVVPEHWSPSQRSTQVQQGIPVGVETQRAFDDYHRAQEEAARAGTELATAQLAEEARQKAYVSKIDASNLEYQQNLRGWQQDRLAEYRQQIDGLMAKAQSQDIDPNQWWNSKSDFGKVATGISMALRGFVFGATGRGEDPATWLNQQVAQNVAAQQARFAQSRAKLGDAVNLYGQMRDQFGDDTKAALATQLAQRQQIIAQLDSNAANTTLPTRQRLIASQMAEKLRGPQFEDRRKLEEGVADHVVTHLAEQFHAATVMGGGGGDIVKLLERANRIKALSDSLSGTDVETAKKRQDLQKEWAETQVAIAKANGSTGPDAKQLEELAKQSNQAGLPSGFRNAERATDLVRNEGALGNVPGTTFPALRMMVQEGTLGHVAYQAARPAQRELLGTLRSLAEAKAHANGQRGLEAIQYNLQTIVGNGSREDILRGIAGAKADLEARRTTIYAGTNPSTQREYARRLQGGGAEVPTGFEPGVANEPPPPSDPDEGP